MFTEGVDLGTRDAFVQKRIPKNAAQTSLLSKNLEFFKSVICLIISFGCINSNCFVAKLYFCVPYSKRSGSMRSMYGDSRRIPWREYHHSR